MFLSWGIASCSVGCSPPPQILMPALGKSLPDSSRESPVCGDFSLAGLLYNFFEREERGRERATANRQKVRREKQVRHGERDRQTDLDRHWAGRQDI